MHDIRFQDLSLSPEMLKAVSAMGFVTASPIQAEAIPPIMLGKDITGQAQTGTGKTAAFGIPILETLNFHNSTIRALVMCPTRELAIQVAGEIKKLAAFKPGIRVLPVYGGEAISNQIRELKRGIHVVVGTPGRIRDHLERKTLNFKTVEMVVLDEADEMLNMGFRPDIEHILSKTPKERQTLLFSATMPPEILEIAKNHQRDPILIKVTPENLTAELIQQYYFATGDVSKTGIILATRKNYNLAQVLVFCNTRHKTEKVATTFKKLGHRAAAINGDLSQPKRISVLGKFKNGEIQILVATDVAARGIDVSNIDAVFNYDIPNDPESYVHRIGRTGRAGKSGMAFSFAAAREDVRKLNAAEFFAKANIERLDVPDGKSLALALTPVGNSLVYKKSGDSHKKDTILKSSLKKKNHSRDNFKSFYKKSST